MEPLDPAIATLVSLAAASTMVLMGFAKRRLVWRHPCPICGRPAALCRCRRTGDR